MTNISDEQILEDLIQRRGESFVRSQLNVLGVRRKELTILSNAGMHPIPHEYVRGELFTASEGNLDFTDINSVNLELDRIVKRVKEKIFSDNWTNVYLIPFGHSSISLTIKMTVFRLLRIETIDVFYFGEGRYDYLDRDSRDSILEA
ncbi:hypothetical protein [Novosphingobium naphthalenivorans]|uniref:hypothetical protein n=1 Tax=Novosphingobium naphthalenivorans TaxID=273168 RepID=UPI0012EDB734|nr:hypothetical protein [Novosphingobium naphthalenivorans]